jgi:hypothetical protein
LCFKAQKKKRKRNCNFKVLRQANDRLLLHVILSIENKNQDEKKLP